MSIQFLALSILLFSCVLISRGVVVNVTVDDQFGDERTNALPQFTSSGWSQGSTCTGCAVKPNVSQAYLGTWHDATLDAGEAGERTFSVGFTGMAVYAFFIVPDTIPNPGITILANMSITLDGEFVGNFVRSPTNQTDFLYNFTGYVNESLADAAHQISFSANAQVSSSLILFDYLVYTTNIDDTLSSSGSGQFPAPTLDKNSTPSSPPPSSIKHPVPVGAVIGGALGGVAFCVLLAILLCYFRRRRLINAQDPASLEAHPVVFVLYNQESPVPGVEETSRRSGGDPRENRREAGRNREGAGKNRERARKKREDGRKHRGGVRKSKEDAMQHRRDKGHQSDKSKSTSDSTAGSSQQSPQSARPPRRPLPDPRIAMLPAQRKRREHEQLRPTEPHP
ncbi:hypothetical protein M0805_008257 [Coniferiporia weirii]|nr:hypothetical protein M0805_008257 [Coniferiporia weirii]